MIEDRKDERELRWGAVIDDVGALGRFSASICLVYRSYHLNQVYAPVYPLALMVLHVPSVLLWYGGLGTANKHYISALPTVARCPAPERL